LALARVDFSTASGKGSTWRSHGEGTWRDESGDKCQSEQAAGGWLGNVKVLIGTNAYATPEIEFDETVQVPTTLSNSIYRYD
jgi:hypothetical protein